MLFLLIDGVVLIDPDYVKEGKKGESLSVLCVDSTVKQNLTNTYFLSKLLYVTLCCIGKGTMSCTHIGWIPFHQLPFSLIRFNWGGYGFVFPIWNVFIVSQIHLERVALYLKRIKLTTIIMEGLGERWVSVQWFFHFKCKFLLSCSTWPTDLLSLVIIMKARNFDELPNITLTGNYVHCLERPNCSFPELQQEASP